MSANSSSGVMADIAMIDRYQSGDTVPLSAAFICYAHADNTSADPKQRWLDRFLEFIRPMTRQEELNVWSDRQIKIGEDWNTRIRQQLLAAKAIVLLVSPAFLASDYIAQHEMPLLLMQAKERGIPIIQLLVSPCLDEETKFRYPDHKTGPNEFSLRSLQAANAPSKTLIEMTEAEQNRVLIEAARTLWAALRPRPTDVLF